jgi:L-alanine-DL-glutamate epimerase-like enolase superfamily enzyme
VTTSPILTWEKLTLNLRNPFRLSYGVSETRQAFVLRLAGDAGWGEGTIPPYYGVDDESMVATWAAAANRTDPLPEETADIEAWVGVQGPAAARCALDLALHDRIGRRRLQPLWQLLGLPQPEPRPTSITISIDTPEAMARMARELSGFPVIKVKLGGDQEDEARLAAIRAARPDARLRIDANAGWSLDQAREYVRRLAAYDLEMIEQPLPKEAIAEMGMLQAETHIPIVADESVQTLANVEQLADAGVAGINVKLMKAGGLTPALRMIRRARERGMRVMLGCMVETSIGTTAMAHLIGLAEWFDLDAPMLISNDPFDGIQYVDHALMVLPDRPGIGVEKKI